MPSLDPQKETTASSNDSERDTTGVALDLEREVRFAVVMFGGVSLAIYINGVAQELLRMVRATAPKSADDNSPEGKEAMLGASELSSSEVVYRKLSQFESKDGKLIAPANLPCAPIRTRFVVDVISGTSAGGINGIFLAKALARNLSMEGLKNLWVSEGDLAKLLNDSESVRDLTEEGFTVQSPQQSLLNSQRMYRKLLDALEEMESSRKEETSPETESPLVGELDLFVTTTDIEGIPLPIKLADNVIYERRYKNVFHFRYAAKDTGQLAVDDFKEENDPFLAFAARCTSSFPFAFEAMRLDDIETVVGEEFDPRKWEKFFSEYLGLAFYDLDKDARGETPDGTIAGDNDDEARKKLRAAFCSRSFGDGGYLDNKPFSYATSRLMRRSSDYLVDRKLVYVEPTPEHPELMPRGREPLDFAENVHAAVLTLPRKENIREDIERLYERNELLQRISNLVKDVDADIGLLPFIVEPKTGEQFKKDDLWNMINFYGISYGAYHRIRVKEVTDLLANFVARAAGYDPSSDAIVAIRELVTAWRERHYEPLKTDAAIKGTNQKKRTENEFLFSFDLPYRLRRLIFLTRRISELSRRGAKGQLNDRAKELLNACKKSLHATLPLHPDDPIWVETFRDELILIKREELTPRLQAARQVEKALLSARSATQTNPNIKTFSELVAALDFKWSELKEILEASAPPERRAKAEAILDTPSSREDTLRKFSEVISAGLLETVPGFRVFDQKDRIAAGVESKIGTASIRDRSTNRDDAAVAARLCLQHFYNAFPHYDLVTYPVQYENGSVEANIVEVFRISPEDAKSLIDERARGPRREKLAGRALMSFGAFLDEGWRKNDMLWGRLDGAERLITSLLPNESEKGVRQNLINEAHMAILNEEIRAQDVDAVCRLISNALAHAEPASEQARKLRTFVERHLEGKSLSSEMNSALRQCLKEPKDIWAYYKKDFTLDRQLDPEHVVRLISRATTITGQMFGGLADKYRFDPGRRVAAWVTRLGTTFWNMIAVAVPQSLGNLFFRHWLGLLYVFSIVVIFAGIIFKSVTALGWELLGVTVVLNLVTRLLGDFVAGEGRWLRTFRRILIAAVVALMGFGMYYVAQHSTDFLLRHDLFFASVVAIVVFSLLGVAEWRRWLRSFLHAPSISSSYRNLWWLTAVTALLLMILGWIGPGGMVQFEFAGNPGKAAPFVRNITIISQLRLQLAFDYLLIFAYSATLASYCAAAAKLFWKQQAISLRKFEREKETKAEPLPSRSQADAEANLEQQPPFPARLMYRLVIVGFALAALQWVAGLADAIENAGLFWFLNETQKVKQTAETALNAQTALTLSFCCAAVKFTLIAAGALYSMIGLAMGAVLKEENPTTRVRNTLSANGRKCVLIALALISLFVLLFAIGALWCGAINPQAWLCRLYRMGG